MKKPLFFGTCTALVTPFLHGQVNLPMLKILLHRQEDAGIPAVVLFGTTGESPTLTDEEKHLILTEARACFRGMLIAGTGSNDTAHAVTLSRQAEQDGADALLVVSPYYNKANEEGLIRHYRTIAQSVQIPVILYNVPSRTGVDIPVSVYRKLAEVPNIAGVKETVSDMKKLVEIADTCPEDFTVWCGSDALTAAYLALGAKGVISVASTVMPEEVSDLTDAGLDGDFDTALYLQIGLRPLNEFLFCEVNPIPVKALLKEMGLDCGSCRLPLTSLSEAHRGEMKSLLQ